MTPTSIVAYLVLFGTVGFLFLFATLTLGRFVRASSPSPEKREPYECGERAVGSSFVQFDLRFYVVALVFIIFEVELAFFFPWATVFGKATQLADPNFPITPPITQESKLPDGSVELSFFEPARQKLTELGVRQPELPSTDEADCDKLIRADARRLAMTAVADIGVFFAVLLVAFAYVWNRGDFQWVRAFGDQTPAQSDTSASNEAAG